MTPKECFEFCRKHEAAMLDLKFVDLLGTWQHCTFPVGVLDEETLREGPGFDGSSIRGWQSIHVSDMMAVPDLETVCLDPFFAKPTASVSAGLWEGQTDEGELGMTYGQLDRALEAIESRDTAGIAPGIMVRVQEMFDESAHKRTCVRVCEVHDQCVCATKRT